MNEATAEQATLGAAFIRASAFSEISGMLTEADFEKPVDRVVFQSMAAIVTRGVAIDPLTVEDEIASRGDATVFSTEGGTGPYILRLANAVPTAENVKHYAAIVAKRSAIRQLRLTCSEIPEAAESSPELAQKLVFESQRLVTQINRGRSRPGVDLTDVLPEALKEFQSRDDARKSGNGRVIGLKSGLTDLDFITGGFRRGTLNVIGARTSLGKTAFGCQIALVNALERRVPALIFSLEMRPMELAERFFSRIGKVDSARLRTGNLTKEDWTCLYSASSQMSQPGLITISNTAGLGGIVAESRAFRVTHPERELLILVDYLQLVRAGAKGRTREQEVGEISATLKALAQELDCAVIAPAQLNRGPESEEREPRISDLRESGAIENDSDVIILIHRERSAATARCALKVVKNRSGGKVDDIEAEWRGATYELCDLPFPPMGRGLS